MIARNYTENRHHLRQIGSAHKHTILVLQQRHGVFTYRKDELKEDLPRVRAASTVGLLSSTSPERCLLHSSRGAMVLVTAAILSTQERVQVTTHCAKSRQVQV